jgi:hypothetical protein
MDLAPRTGSAKSKRVLLVTGDQLNRVVMLCLMEDHDMETLPLASVSESRRVISGNAVSTVVCEECLSDGSYRNILQELDCHPESKPAVFSDDADWDLNGEAMNLGGV